MLGVIRHIGARVPPIRAAHLAGATGTQPNLNVFRAFSRIDHLGSLWQPRCYAPVWGLIVVRAQKERLVVLDEEVVWKRNEELTEMMSHTKGESDRGITLIVAAHIEECLRRILESVLIDSTETKNLFEGPYAPFGTLSGKSQAAFVMGLLTKSERDRIDAVRRVRNVFAHQASASFEHPDIVKICNKPAVNSGRMTIRDEFLHTAINVALPLLYRDLQIVNWRREELTQDVVNAWHDPRPDAL